MDDVVTIVYYAQGNALRLIKAFRSAKRAQEYLQMMQAAPFPGEVPAGYHLRMIHLN